MTVDDSTDAATDHVREDIRDNVPDQAPPESCDVCGSAAVEWRRCKQVCLNCGTILKSCADL